jgi:hypothetical protein
VVGLPDLELDALLRRPAMAFIYQISFDIHPDQMGELEIGSSLERTLGYLRSLLPTEVGFITVRAARSVQLEHEEIQVLIESEWEYWNELENHRHSNLAEDKILQEFEPHIELDDLEVHVFEEVA